MKEWNTRCYQTSWWSRSFVGELPLELQNLRKEERKIRLVNIFEQNDPIIDHIRLLQSENIYGTNRIIASN